MNAAALPDEPLSRHTPCRTGGPCDTWVVAHDLEAVLEWVAECRDSDRKLTMLGAGTRCIVRDGPVSGVVLRLGTDFVRLSCEDWTVGAGYPVASLSGAAAKAGRAGLERFICGPGTVGGSLLCDEGWEELVRSVRVVRRNQAVDISLEEARKKRPVVLSASLSLTEDDPEQVSKRTLENWARQRPAPCSSWYEPPKRGSLRKLLGSVRLPMVRLRQVAIPDAAPELLVNLGEGTAADLHLLHKSAIERVSRVQAEDLKSRMKWIGSDDLSEDPA